MRDVTTELRWRDVLRLGLVQVAIGAVAALMMSTLNRVMVVELGLPAAIPAALVGLHFAVQLLRARLGFASDRSARRAPWILGGAALFAVGGALAGAATALTATQRALGLVLAAVAYAAIGIGLSASGTSLLALVSERANPRKLGAVAAVLWIMMIVGIAMSAGITGALLDPFSFARLAWVSAGVGGVALALTVVATVSGPARLPVPPRHVQQRDDVAFGATVRAALAEPAIRGFAAFVFLAMLAFSAQDLILEPFAGQVFGFTPGESTKLGGMHHMGVLLGMLGAAWASTRIGTLRAWAALGCGLSATAFVLLAQTPAWGSADALRGIVLFLGIANGIFTVGGVGGMMALTAAASKGDTGLRLGIFGAAQGIAYGIGGFSGGILSDVAKLVLGSPAAGYAAVFVLEAVLFAGAALLALRTAPASRARGAELRDGGDVVLVAMR